MPPSPNFSEIHIIRTLLYLREKTGRKELAKRMNIGQGSVRTIFKILKKENLIDSDKKGHILNENGIKKLNEYLKKWTFPFKIYSNDIGKGKKIGIIIHNIADKISYCGMKERDIAVRNGSDGALVLIYDEREKVFFKRLKFPNDIYSIEDFPEFIEKIKNINFKDKDVLVVTFSDDYNISENAAIAVALRLTKNL